MQIQVLDFLILLSAVIAIEISEKQEACNCSYAKYSTEWYFNNFSVCWDLVVTSLKCLNWLCKFSHSLLPIEYKWRIFVQEHSPKFVAYTANHLLDVKEGYVIHLHVSISFPKDYLLTMFVCYIVFVARVAFRFCAEITQRLYVR